MEQTGAVRARWARLGLTALTVSLVAAYAAFVGLMIVSRGLLTYVGIDFATVWATLQIARDHGFAAVYDLQLQAQYHHVLRPGYAITFWVYLPTFVVPLLPLLLF